MDLQLELIEVVGPLGQKCPQAIVPPILRWASPLRVRKKHGVGSEEVPRRLDSASVERLVGLTHDLHVLPRHRLLRQPYGCEGFVDSCVLVDVEDAAIFGEAKNGGVANIGRQPDLLLRTYGVERTDETAIGGGRHVLSRHLFEVESVEPV